MFVEPKGIQAHGTSYADGSLSGRQSKPAAARRLAASSALGWQTAGSASTGKVLYTVWAGPLWWVVCMHLLYDVLRTQYYNQLIRFRLSSETEF